MDPSIDYSERRSVARYESEGVTVFTGWTGPGGFASTRAEILNFGLGGVAISVAGFPSGVCSAWIRLIGNDNGHPEWVSVNVLEICNRPGGEQRIRMKFDGFCPYEFFKAILISSGAVDDDTPSDRRPHGAPPSPGAASLSRAAAPLPDVSPAWQQPELARVAQNNPAPENHLKNALSARESGRANNLRGPSRIPGW